MFPALPSSPSLSCRLQFRLPLRVSCCLTANHFLQNSPTLQSCLFSLRALANCNYFLFYFPCNFHGVGAVSVIGCLVLCSLYLEDMNRNNIPTSKLHGNLLTFSYCCFMTLFDILNTLELYFAMLLEIDIFPLNE